MNSKKSAEVICSYSDWSVIRFSDGSLLYHQKETDEVGWVKEVFKIKASDYENSDFSDMDVIEMCPKNISYLLSGELDDFSAYCFWEEVDRITEDVERSKKDIWYKNAVEHFIDTVFLGPKPVYTIEGDYIILSSYEQGEIVQRKIEIDTSAAESLFYYFYADVYEEDIYKAFGKENIKEIAKFDSEIELRDE